MKVCLTFLGVAAGFSIVALCLLPQVEATKYSDPEAGVTKATLDFLEIANSGIYGGKTKKGHLRYSKELCTKEAYTWYKESYGKEHLKELISSTKSEYGQRLGYFQIMFVYSKHQEFLYQQREL